MAVNIILRKGKKIRWKSAYILLQIILRSVSNSKRKQQYISKVVCYNFFTITAIFFVSCQINFLSRVREIHTYKYFLWIIWGIGFSFLGRWLDLINWAFWVTALKDHFNKMIWQLQKKLCVWYIALTRL